MHRQNITIEIQFPCDISLMVAQNLNTTQTKEQLEWFVKWLLSNLKKFLNCGISIFTCFARELKNLNISNSNVKQKFTDQTKSYAKITQGKKSLCFFEQLFLDQISTKLAWEAILVWACLLNTYVTLHVRQRMSVWK